jgi:hypothetical protein
VPLRSRIHDHARTPLSERTNEVPTGLLGHIGGDVEVGDELPAPEELPRTEPPSSATPATNARLAVKSMASMPAPVRGSHEPQGPFDIRHRM